jgi:hypothetical protein
MILRALMDHYLRTKQEFQADCSSFLNLKHFGYAPNPLKNSQNVTQIFVFSNAAPGRKANPVQCRTTTTLAQLETHVAFRNARLSPNKIRIQNARTTDLFLFIKPVKNRTDFFFRNLFRRISTKLRFHR